MNAADARCHLIAAGPKAGCRDAFRSDPRGPRRVCAFRERGWTGTPSQAGADHRSSLPRTLRVGRRRREHRRQLLARRRMRMSQSAAASCSRPSRTWQQRSAKLTCSRRIAATEGKMQRACSSEYSMSFQRHLRFYKFILVNGRIGENPFQPTQSDHPQAPPLFRSAGIHQGRRAGSLREPPTSACSSELSWQP